MIRTMQAQFSWDWGPAFPTMGIYKPIFIREIQSCQLSQFYAQPILVDGFWEISVDLKAMCHATVPRWV